MLPLLAVVALLNGQIADNWTFGYHSGLNFASTPPSYFIDSINGQECSLDNPFGSESSFASNSISDCDGNLIFYTNGLLVWNKKHRLMPNYCLNDSFQAFYKRK